MEKLTYYWNRLKEHPVAYTLVRIGALILALAIVAHILMLMGTRHGAHRTVPDFSGIALDQAEVLADEHGLNLQINDSLFVPAYEGGIVLAQLPEAGVEVKPGRTIYITINSFREKMVPVPYVASRSLRQAKNMLEIAGLEIDELIYRSDMATNYVLEEYCKGRPVHASSHLEAEMGSGITLYVGVAGAPNTIVPQLIGFPLKEAKSRLWEMGLNVGKVSFDEGITLLNERDARVYIQTPTAERGATLGTRVDLRLTLNQTKLTEHSTAAEQLAKKTAAERLQSEQQLADSLAEASFNTITGDTTQQGNDGFFNE
ncbi:MAG: PASTA domain-containing protein [Alistipes sp.]